MTRNVLFMSVLLAWPEAAGAQQATVVDDAYVSSLRPNREFGTGATSDTLQVSPHERTFARFSINLPSGTPGSHVGQATLKVFVRNVRTPGEIRVHRVTGAWSETAVTAATAPAIGAQEGAPVVIAQASERGWVAMDVTQLVRDWLNGVAVNDGVALVGAGATDVALDSKENVATSHEPVLEVLLNHAVTADDAARLGGVDAAGYVLANDFRLNNERAPTADSNHYVRNTPNAQNAQFNVANGLVRGNLTVLGSLNAPNLNVAGSFIQNQTTQPQAGAGFNVAGDGTAGGTLSGGTINAATQFNLAGQRVLSAAAPGSANLFIGLEAGAPSAGFANTFVGSRAGLRTTFGSLNAFVGWDAGRENTEGCCNSFFGNRAGELNTRGSANAFFGGLAGGANTEGIRNAFFGDLAGFDLDLTDAGLGPGTNTGVTIGNFNTFLGSRSGLRITAGSNNTFVGYNTVGAPNLNYGTAIGSGATVTTDNTIVLGRSVDTVVVPGALSLNIVDAATQFNLAGQHVLRSTADSTVTVGVGAGSATPGVHNTFVGGSAGASNAGFSNVFVGWNAGALNTNGHFNTFVGAWAGRENTVGTDNSFFGDGTGSSNTIGNNNSYFGADAGRGCDLGFKVPCVTGTTAANNSFFGAYAGRKSAAGSDNAYFGYRAGYHNVSSSFNSFFGSYAGENTTSSYNAFFGTQAGQANTTGSRNAFFGTEAGSHNVNGFENVFVGAHAGVLSTHGSLNTFVGTSAGFNNQGSHNSFFGTNAGRENTTGNHNSFFGRAAGYSNTGDRNSFVGAGAGALTTSGSDNTFFGSGSGYENTIGTDNTFLGSEGGRANVAGSHNTLIGSRAEVAAGDLTFATALGAGAVVDASNTVALGRAVDTVRIPGSLSIAGTFAAAAFTGNGTGLTHLDAGNITTGTLSNARLGLIPTANIADSAVTASKIAGGQVVRALNGLTDQVVLAAGANISITPAGNTLTIAATGGGVGLSAPGLLNLFGGPGAGANTTPSVPFPFSGNRNTFVGSNAGAANSQGAWNTFFGAVAGEGNTTGMHNTVVGAEAGQSNAAGDSNSFFGSSAGRLTTGFRNAFFGAAAGEYTLGSDNAFVGSGSGTNSTNAFNNAFLGSLAGGDNTTGSRNVFLGRMAGLANTIGGDNTFVGYRAGDSVTTTTGNTAVGANADVAAGIANATAMGANAVANQSNSLVLGNNVDVGIGSSAPQARLDVRGGHILVGSAGQGVILKSPDGGTCRLLTIANGTGELTLTAVPCPM